MRTPARFAPRNLRYPAPSRFYPLSGPGSVTARRVPRALPQKFFFFFPPGFFSAAFSFFPPSAATSVSLNFPS